MKQNVCIIGAGNMAISYTAVLKAMEINPIVIGNSEASAIKFKEQTGVNVLTGGYAKVLKELKPIPQYAIVATSIGVLADACEHLMQAGVKKILCEKPLSYSLEVLHKLQNLCREYKADIYVAYNRRFYTSLLQAKELMQKDGGVISVFFDFTEWETHIHSAINSEDTKKNWLIANSSHVIDMVFSVIGSPKDLSPLRINRSVPVYIGQGESMNSIPFSYHSDWASAGRWGIEFKTKEAKYIFRPLEKLQIQKRLKMAIEELPTDEIDIKFKPGLFKQTEAFLKNEVGLLNLNEHITNLDFYLRMQGASSNV